MRFSLKRLLSLILLYVFFVITYFGYFRYNTEQDTERWNVSKVEREERVSTNRPDISFTTNLNAKIDCLNLNYSDTMLQIDTWSQVDSSRHLFVFSAYYEKSAGVTIIGAKSSTRMTYLCQLWYRQDSGHVTKVETSRTYLMTHGEGHGYRYSAINLKCATDPQKTNTVVPFAVSVTISDEPCQQPRRLIPVKEIKQTSQFKWNFTVCLKPLHFRYGRAYEFVEWVELTKLLGADHFVLYNSSTASNINELVDYYSKQGEAEVVQWDLPMKVHQWPPAKERAEIHTYGIIASINECLFRVRESSRFLIFVDLDEFIIPRLDNDNTWHDMLKRMPENKGAYIFRNVFFRKEWNNPSLEFPGKDIADKYKMLTLQKTEKENVIWKHNSRSKYICRPNSVERLGNHHIERFVSGQRAHHVPTELGLVHHYRSFENYNDTQKRITDLTMIHKYKDELIERVVNVWSKFEHVPLDIPIV